MWFSCLFCRIGFIDFETVEEAQSALKKMNGKTFEGRQMTITFAETREGGTFLLHACVVFCLLLCSFLYRSTICMEDMQNELASYWSLMCQPIRFR